MANKKPDGTKVFSPLLRVLILEDNSLDAKLAARVLERSGAKVEFEVTDSAEVFQKRL
jgi:CheY-like chemotaxis protein